MVYADVIITNANVITLDKKSSRAGSVAIKDGLISGIWQDKEPPRGEIEDIKNLTIIDAEGGTLIPGFIDTHTHLGGYGLQKKHVNCGSPLNKSIADIQKRIADKVANTPAGEWIIGYAYDDTLLVDKRHPNRADLDKIAPNHPVHINHISGHFGVINSKGLEIAGMDDSVKDPEGGHFGRDEAGSLDGVLYETANLVIRKFLPSSTLEEYVKQIGKGAKDYLAQGITTANDAAIRDELDLQAHIAAAKQQVNPMHMRLMIMHDMLRNHDLFKEKTAEEVDHYLDEQSEGRVRLDSAKMFQDGSIQGLTGALREPYHTDSDLYGDFIFDQSFLNEEVAHLHRRGFRMAIHGNGDRAIGSILDAYELAIAKYPRTDHRHRIEHVQTATVADLDRMQRLQVAGSFFINHVYYWGDRHKALFLGPDRARRISPLAEAQERNLLFTLHSDCPVTPVSPLFSIWAAVNRVTREGHVLGPEQRIDVETALRTMTIDGAKLNFNEDIAGSIEVGKQADFALLGADPTAVNPMEIIDVLVLKTIIGGKVVFEK